MDIFVATTNGWKKINSAWIATTDGWKKITSGWVATTNGWKKFFTGVLSAPINTVAPVVSPSSGPAGSTTFSTTNGTWSPDDADGVYGYQWQFYDSGSLYGSISGATSSTYTPSSNYVSVYGSVLRCRVTATNATGSTSATSNEVTVTTPVPTGGSVSISPTGTQLAGTTLTVSTTGWSNSPTSYSLRLYASTSNPPTTGNLLVASSSSSSLTYTITNADAAAPAFYFKAFATATNSGGTSSQVESNVVLSAPLPVAPSGGSVSLSGTGVAGTTLTATTSGWSGSPTSYNVYIYASTSNPPFMSDSLKASSASSSVSYTVTTFDASPPPYYFRAFATATNAAGTSSIAVSNVILSSLPAVSAPSTPTGVTNTYNGGTSYTFSWNASSGATGYYVNYGENTTQPSPNPPSSIVGNVRSNVIFVSGTSYSFTSLSSSNWVGFQVAATNSGGTSNYSSPTVYR